MSWKEYVSSLDEVEAYQKKVRRNYAKDRQTYLKGPQDPGPPYTKKPKKTRSKSAPPGFGAIGEEVDPESFEPQETLQPEIWEHSQLRPDVREELMGIVDGFMGQLKMDVRLEDVRFTGSLANYNWSLYSDIDLHLVVDFAGVNENEAWVKSFFDKERMRWNDENDIEIYGFEVEIYVENLREAHHSGGVYSVLNDEWVEEPEPYEGEIDFATARKKSNDLTTQINLIRYIVDAGNFEGALRSIERIKSKIRHMRRAGLETPAREYSSENIAFKILRRDNVLSKLNNLQQRVYDSDTTWE